LGRAVNNLTDRSGDQARTTGVVYLLISSICFSFAGVFTKGVEAGSWDVIFWRAGFGLVFLIIFYLGTGKIARQVNLKPSGIMISLIAVISTTAFISSFKHTSIANVAMIYASTPMLAGFLGWWVMREHISRKEFVASIVVLFGVAVVVHGSLGTINIYGDTLAILMAITMAMIIVLFRRFPETPSGGVNMLSCIVLMPICMLFGDPFAASSHDLFCWLSSPSSSSSVILRCKRDRNFSRQPSPHSSASWRHRSPPYGPG
jgi:drug/metabolite transporter (DMT)-like permease